MPEAEYAGPERRVVKVATFAANLTPQQIVNLMIIVFVAIMCVQNYQDRHDRMDSQILQIRSYESQGELNRQSISMIGERAERAGVAQTQALQTLSVEIGKLQAVVGTLQRSVEKKWPGGD